MQSAEIFKITDVGASTSRNTDGHGQFSIYVEVTRLRQRCHSLDEADWETAERGPLTAWKEFHKSEFEL